MQEEDEGGPEPAALDEEDVEEVVFLAEVGGDGGVRGGEEGEEGAGEEGEGVEGGCEVVHCCEGDWADEGRRWRGRWWVEGWGGGWGGVGGPPGGEGGAWGDCGHCSISCSTFGGGGLVKRERSRGGGEGGGFEICIMYAREAESRARGALRQGLWRQGRSVAVSPGEREEEKTDSEAESPPRLQIAVPNVSALSFVNKHSCAGR